MRFKLFRRYLILSGLLLAFALLEIIFQIITPSGVISKCGNNERCNFSEYHPILGYSGTPNISSFYKNAKVVQNSSGHRGANLPYKKAAGVKRILFIGDSQTWGYHLSENETISYMTEKELNDKQPANSPIRFETLNLGVSGYGTDQAFLSYILEGRNYNPDLTIYTAFQNDKNESENSIYWGVNKPKFYIQGDQLCLSNVPVPRQPGWYNNRVFPLAWRFISLPFSSQKLDLANSATLRYFMNREWPLSVLSSFSDSQIATVRQYVNCIEHENGPSSDGKEIVKRLVTELNRITHEDGGKLLVMFSPHPRDIANETLQPTGYWGLRELLKQEKIPMLDLTEISIDALKRRKIHYQFSDWHFNPEGAAAAAHELYNSIIELTF